MGLQKEMYFTTIRGLEPTILHIDPSDTCSIHLFVY